MSTKAQIIHHVANRLATSLANTMLTIGIREWHFHSCIAQFDMFEPAISGYDEGVVFLHFTDWAKSREGGELEALARECKTEEFYESFAFEWEKVDSNATCVVNTVDSDWLGSFKHSSSNELIKKKPESVLPVAFMRKGERIREWQVKFTDSMHIYHYGHYVLYVHYNKPDWRA